MQIYEWLLYRTYPKPLNPQLLKTALTLSLVKNLLRFQIKSTSTVYCMDKKIYLSLGDIKTHSHSRGDTKSRL